MLEPVLLDVCGYNQQQYGLWARGIDIVEWSPVNYAPSHWSGRVLGQRAIDLIFNKSEDGGIFGLAGRFPDSTLHCIQKQADLNLWLDPKVCKTYGARQHEQLNRANQAREAGVQLVAADRNYWSDYAESCIEFRFVMASPIACPLPRLTSVVKTVFVSHTKHSSAYTSDLCSSSRNLTNPAIDPIRRAVLKQPTHIVYINMADVHLPVDDKQFCMVCLDPLQHYSTTIDPNPGTTPAAFCAQCERCQCCKENGCPGRRHHYTRCEFYGQGKRKSWCDCIGDPPGLPLGPVFPPAGAACSIM